MVTDRSDALAELLDRLEEEYPDAHAMDPQPDWMSSLQGCHDAIEYAYARELGSVPEPKIELIVSNQYSTEPSYYRIIAMEGEWIWPHEDPPAGLAAALDWLQANADATEFAAWWYEHHGIDP